MTGSVPSIPFSRTAEPAGRPMDVLGLWTRLECMFQVYRQRRALQELDDRALKDIGISRADVEREASRKPWDLPDTWR